MNEYCPSPHVHPRRDGRRGTLQLDGSRRRNGTQAATSHDVRRQMRLLQEEDDQSGDLMIKCTRKSCQSCTAGLIADCVAVCCCPCAVVNILVFAFLKVPWMVGRRLIWKLGKKKKKKKQEAGSGSREKLESRNVKCAGGEMTINYQLQEYWACGGGVGMEEEELKLELEDMGMSSRKSRVVDQEEEKQAGGASEFVFSSAFGDEMLKDNFSARFEAEDIWFELYQFGHLGFGRVSFTGIPSLCNVGVRATN